ncbi:MAG: lasso peptide biosynthesis B2 protein [Methylocystis silviterrae]|uniref:lasso peptide biosynthesis B2 protein n=1 Tax=Methylocystis silviterrae TaxID=2743612 RepID=UPI003C76C6E5
MRLLSNLYKFSLAPPVERRLFVLAAFLLVFMRGSLSVISVRTLWRFLERASLVGVRHSAGQSDIGLDQVSRALARAARHVAGATCLSQALAGTVLLRRYGHRATLCIGVAKSEGEFGAHAWVECDGPVVIGWKGHFSKLFILP